MKENRVPDPGRWQLSTGSPILDRANTLLEALGNLFLSQDFVISRIRLIYIFGIHGFIIILKSPSLHDSAKCYRI